MTPQKPHSLAGDAVFEAEQQHLSQTCDTLETMAHHVEAAMVHAQKQAAVDKRSMAEDLSPTWQRIPTLWKPMPISKR